MEPRKHSETKPASTDEKNKYQFACAKDKAKGYMCTHVGSRRCSEHTSCRWCTKDWLEEPW